MSTMRYSGNVRIRITYRDAGRAGLNGTYRCFIVCHEPREILGAVRRRKYQTVFVGAPAILTHAVDSPQAFDDTARAALAFAHEGLANEATLALDGSDWHVGRSPEKRWPTCGHPDCEAVPGMMTACANT